MLRRLKFTYILYNFFHKKQLLHNKRIYKDLGLKKRYYSPISNKDFKNVKQNINNNSNHILSLNKTDIFQNLDDVSRQSLLNFHNEGYAVLNNYLDDKTVDLINNEIEDLLAQKQIEFRYGNKLMFAINKSTFLKNIGENEKIVELINSIMGESMQLFQSINFKMGSEQHTHSDSIHMTTYPLGGLLGVWIALEDITLENGPLHYYPKSHLLPYYMNEDYQNEGNFFLIGNKGYGAYEEMIEQKKAEHSITKQVFTAKKGDVLIWHANLFHGGEPHINKEMTRKSMVLHYFTINRVCYHEITQRPALMNY